MTVREAFVTGTAQLRRHRCSGSVPAREAEDLLSAVLLRSREFLLAHPETPLTTTQRTKFLGLLKRRLAHVPLEYLLGYASFYSRKFTVRRGALIPRPATEWLVGAALDDIGIADRATVIDVGTGSGAIAVTVARERPLVQVFATDVSLTALRLAKENAASHGVTDRITFVRRASLPEQLPEGPVHIIANLPYIPTSKIAALPREVRDHEPRLALDGGKDGLGLFRALLAEVGQRNLRSTLYCECLPGQYRQLVAAARRSLPGCIITEIRSGAARIGVRVLWKE
jgi:release factor glutamine methyltransferase